MRKRHLRRRQRPDDLAGDDKTSDDHPIVAALRERYRARLLEQAVQLEDLWREFAATTEHERRSLLVAGMRRLIHDLTGSAETFGFAAIGVAAHPLDIAIIMAIKDQKSFSAAAGTGVEWAEPIARLVALCRSIGGNQV